MTADVTIAVCTYRRASLAACLDSVLAQALPAGVRASVLVVDNDAAASAAAIVAAAAAGAAWPVAYRIEPEKGIAAARNRVLAEAGDTWLAMLDDDEIAAPGWLAALLAAAEHHAADAVMGGVYPSFTAPVPDWLAAGGFFQRRFPPRGAQLAEGRTGNALVRRGAVGGLRFDRRYDRTGGEDTDFFRRFAALGGRIVSAPEAAIFELIPPERACVAHLRRHALRVGETYARQTFRTPAQRIAGATRGAALALAALTLAPPARLLGRAPALRLGLAARRNVGKLRAVCGWPPVEPYA